MKKRLFALLMAVCMVITVLPVGVLAEEMGQTPAVTTPVEPTTMTEPTTPAEPTPAQIVQGMIDALPGEVTAENQAAIIAQLEAIDEAKLPLGDEFFNLDITRYAAAIAALEALEGTPGAQEPQPLSGEYVIPAGTSVNLNDVDLTNVTDILNNGTITGGRTTAYVTNYGTIESGNFYSTVVNSGLIQNGHFYEIVSNSYGTIQDGIFESTVSNFRGVVSGGTFNRSTSDIYTVTFNSNGGSAVSTQYRANAPATKPTDPTRTDSKGGTYVLKGWYSGGKEYTFTENVTSDITLTALWDYVIPAGTSEVLDFDVLHEAGSGTINSVINNGTIADTKNTKQPYPIINNGIIQDGYFPADVTNYGTIQNGRYRDKVVNYGTILAGEFGEGMGVTNSGTITGGNFTRAGIVTNEPDGIVSGGNFEGARISGIYTVTFDARGGTPTPDAQIRANAPATKPTDPTNGSQKFCGWYVKTAEGYEPYDFTAKVTADITLHANFDCALGHIGGTATCSSKAICENCGQPYGELDSTNHNYGALIPAEAEVHTKDELKPSVDAHYHCSACGKYFDENKAETTLAALTGETPEHTGGEATCKGKAVCEICGAEYGTLNPENHAEEKTWTVKNETQHEQKWSCCGQTVVALEDHEWENGKCTECGYVCAHSGGSADCQHKAICEHCGEEYGELNDTIHTGEPVMHKTATTHEKTWNCCGKTMVAETPHNWYKGVCRDCKYVCQHSGGTATCKEKAVCEICGESYGELSTTNHVGGTIDRFTCIEAGNDTFDLTQHVHGVLCVTCGNPISAEKEPHVWENGKCKFCNLVCDHAENTNHATCGHAAQCSICAEEVEAALSHWFSQWKPCSDGYHAAYCIRKDCDGTAGMPCEWFNLTFTTSDDEEVTVSICPVCGAVRHEDVTFRAIKNATVKANEKWLPRGELIVRGMENPYGECKYLFTVGYEFSGWLEAFLGEVTVTIPVELEGDFRLVYVEMDEETQEQILMEVECTYDDGALTFETENQGIYLILPVTE